jgi:hypothetical protein
MPATPSQLRRPVVVNHTIDFGDGVTVKFVFDRNKLTDAWMNEWTRIENERNAPQMNAMLDDLVMSWDVLEEDGSPYPKNPETIGFLFTIGDKGRIFEDLIDASVPSRAEGNASSERTSTPSSASTPPQETPPNGTVPSLSPAPSASLSPT